MVYVLRHLLSVLMLPTTVVVLVPIWLARRYDEPLTWPDSFGGLGIIVGGAALLLIGVALFAASLRHFFSEGRGTLAPWDPPQVLVVRGPYRYVRNPMISGVIFTLFGIAAIMRSLPHGAWAAAFLAINAIYIPGVEEPGLSRRFGEAYDRYCEHVPRFVPRWRPWHADGAG